MPQAKQAHWNTKGAPRPPGNGALVAHKLEMIGVKNALSEEEFAMAFPIREPIIFGNPGFFGPRYLVQQKSSTSLTSWIIGLNFVVFALWILSGESETGFMARNFLVSWQGLTEGRVWTLFTSVFSHATVLHLFVNMFVLHSFGPVMEGAIGRKSFFRFYLTAGVLASLSHALVSAFLLGAPSLPALGASGAISGLVLLFALMFPRERILFFGLLPAPALWAALLLVGIDLWGLLDQAGGGGLPIGYGAHLGGAVTGFIYYFAVIRRRFPAEEIW